MSVPDQGSRPDRQEQHSRPDRQEQQRQLDRWERLEQPAMFAVPYIAPVLSVILVAAIGAGSTASLLVDIALAALAAAWMLWQQRPVGDRGRRDRIPAQGRTAG
jgi:hypothetical protein